MKSDIKNNFRIIILSAIVCVIVATSLFAFVQVSHAKTSIPSDKPSSPNDISSPAEKASTALKEATSSEPVASTDSGTDQKSTQTPSLSMSTQASSSSSGATDEASFSEKTSQSKESKNSKKDPEIDLGKDVDKNASLKDQKKAIKKKAKKVEDALEFVDGSIAKEAGKLTSYKAQAPIAQQELNTANTSLTQATTTLQTVQGKLTRAQDAEKTLKTNIQSEEQAIKDKKNDAKTAVVDSYKQYSSSQNVGGLPQAPNAEDVGNVAVKNNVKTKNSQAIIDLTAAVSQKKNTLKRIAAKEKEIKGLEAEAKTAVDVQQTAQTAAQKKKTTLDNLVAEAKELKSSLEEKRPEIKKEIKDLEKQQKSVAKKIKKEQEAQRKKWEKEQKQKGEEPVVEEVGKGLFGFIQPVDAPITSGFGMREVPAGTVDFLGTGTYMHTGMDFGGQCGATVKAPADGTVSEAGWLDNGGGNTVKIDQGIVGGNAVSTIFYHNTEVLVAAGQQVKQGQEIATIGTTGNSTGCHSHFEVWVNGEAVDPATVL